MTGRHAIVNPAQLAAPIGFSHGVVAAGGRIVFLAGQVGCDADGQVTAPDDLVAQIDRALANLLAVAREAGAGPDDVVKLVIYVTDVEAYRTVRSDLGPVWRAHFGRYYPAITLVGVAALFEPAALVEIDGVAVIEVDQRPAGTRAAVETSP